MEQTVHLITLATPDLDAARAFYVDGLGWEPTLDVAGEILFFQIGPGLVLGLFLADRFDEDLGRTATGTTTASGITLSHNVVGEQEVREVLETAERAGATVVKSPQRADFGGYHGHFADPNGVLWEVCHNPGWHVDTFGRVVLGPADGA